MKSKGNMVGAGLITGLVTVLLGGCAGTAKVVPSKEKPVTKSEVQQQAEKSAAVPVETFLSGKVVESMRATGYTYIQLENNGKRAWFAVPSIEVKVGQEIVVSPGTQMGLFNSKTLNRKFDSIIFSPGLVEDPNTPPPAAEPTAATEQDAMPSGHPALDADPKAYEGKATKEQLRKAGISTISGKVLETMNSGGYTYILIANGDKNVWGAVPTTDVAVGQEVELLPGQTMSNFSSKGLNKTFESVIFSTGVVPVKK